MGPPFGMPTIMALGPPPSSPRRGSSRPSPRARRRRIPRLHPAPPLIQTLGEDILEPGPEALFGLLGRFGVVDLEDLIRERGDVGDLGVVLLGRAAPEEGSRHRQDSPVVLPGGVVREKDFPSALRLEDQTGPGAVLPEVGVVAEPSGSLGDLMPEIMSPVSAGRLIVDEEAVPRIELSDLLLELGLEAFHALQPEALELSRGHLCQLPLPLEVFLVFLQPLAQCLDDLRYLLAAPHLMSDRQGI